MRVQALTFNSFLKYLVNKTKLDAKVFESAIDYY